MREILFRGKRLDTGEWTYGVPLEYSGQFGIVRCTEDTRILPYKDDNFVSHYVEELYSPKVDPKTIGEYTGLTDKNGVKIFDGDIVRDIFNASVVGIVRYGEYRNTFNDDEHGGHVGFYIEWQDKKDLLRKDLVYWMKNSEFIGNIFDNPELFEEEGNE